MSYAASRFVDGLAAYCRHAFTRGRGLVAIDGRGCSGKSTLATELAEALGSYVIGVDSFFAAGPGNRLRWQEFTDAVAQLRRLGTLRYQPYDWEKDALLPAEMIDAPLVIIEGLYAMHRDVVEHYDARIWVEADLSTRWDRVLARDGPSRIDRWRNEWVPMEQRYVDEQRPWRHADVVVAGPGLTLHQLRRSLGE